MQGTKVLSASRECDLVGGTSFPLRGAWLSASPVYSLDGVGSVSKLVLGKYDVPQQSVNLLTRVTQ